MAESAVSVLLREMIAKLPPPSFSPVLTFDFEHVRQAVSMVEAAIEASQAEARQVVSEETAKRIASPGRSFITEPHFPAMGAMLLDVDLTFPLILRRSLLIAVCSHVEHVLKQWCEFLHDEWKLTRAPQSVLDDKALKRRTTAFKLLRYLDEVAGLNVSEFETWPEWTTFDAYWAARNALVHEGGDIDKPDALAKIETLEYVEADISQFLSMADKVVHLLPGACEHATETARLLIERLYTSCQADPRSSVDSRSARRTNVAMPTHEEILAIAPNGRTVVTVENLAEVSHAHAHPFTEIERLEPGDVIWSPPHPGGSHLVVIWFSRARAGLGRNGMGIVEGELEIRDGVPVLVGDDGRAYDLARGVNL